MSETSMAAFMGKRHAAALTLFACVLWVGSGCDGGGSGPEFNHVPPAGEGSLIVANSTGSGIGVYTDGVLANQVSDGSYSAADLTSGAHRVVLLDTEAGGVRSYSADVDILQGQLTVLRVYIDSSSERAYKVTQEFQ